MSTYDATPAATDGPVPEPVDRGPRHWLSPQVEAMYSRLLPREQEADETEIASAEATAVATLAAAATEETPPAPAPLRSRLQPGRREEVLAPVERDYWSKRLQEYQQRRVATIRAAAEAVPPPGQPAIPGANNWVPLGPAVIARGQAVGRPAVAGRVAKVAIAPGGNRMYAATANGGVFRSDDAGSSWFSTMDGFDLDPNNFASTSLAGGAIAIDPTNQDRVFVGTGEGDTDTLFTLRITNALPSYRGIGPIRSDDGGINWVSEASSPSLAGFAFYELAVDPGNPDNVVAATTNGLYQRTFSGGAPLWQQRRAGNHGSVVAARSGGVTTFFAAPRGGPIVRSTDGITWSTVGTGFPTADVGRIALGVQPDNPNVLYALVASDSSGGLHGIYRLDGGGGAWNTIAGAPNILPGQQGDYDLCIAVDPNNADRIYVGGDRGTAPPWPGNIQRCDITSSGGAFSIAATQLGDTVHADIHALAFVPGDSNRLWAATDGGLFLNSNPTGAGAFEPRNTGLSCLCSNFIGMSPSEPAIIYSGLQDNGTARYLGEELWRHVQGGDGGYCIVHPTNPFRVLVYANGRVYRTSTGGGDYGEWTVAVSPPWSIMAEPLVAAPGDERVAFGAGNELYVSNDFGTSWPGAATLTLPFGSGLIFSLAFANPDRLFIGTTTGRVFRADRAGGTWSLTRIDNAAGGPLGLVGLISDIAVDVSDAGRNSIYITFGGTGDFRHVWHFNGTAWQARSGSGMTSLIDVEHNAIVVDPLNPAHLYAGANIGVWRSTDSGTTWAPMQDGLTDAPVFDLQIHESLRLLRAATHGRGLYEFRLDPPVQGGVELYLRDTMLDTARGENTDGRNDPSRWPTGPVAHYLSPNLKVDTPTPAGYQTPTNQIDFFQFHEVIVDGSNGVGTIDPPAVVHNRVYALVHNRGPLPVAAAHVTAAVTNASTVLNPLPAGYTANIQSGTPLPGANWTTLGTVPLTGLRAGFPQVAPFDLPSNVLPLPASLPGQSHYCLVAFAHAADDPYTATEQQVDTLTLQERKVAQKNLHIVQFLGTPPPPEAWLGIWARLDVTGSLFADSGLINLTVDLEDFKGKLRFVAPEDLLSDEVLEQQQEFEVTQDPIVKEWFTEYSEKARQLVAAGQYSEAEFERLVQAMTRVADRPVFAPREEASAATLFKIPITGQDRHTIFFRIDPPEGAEVGQSWTISLVQRDAEQDVIQGGATYSVRINRPIDG